MSNVIACIHTYKATRGRVALNLIYKSGIQICTIPHSHKLVLNTKRFTCKFLGPIVFICFSFSE